MRNTATGNYLLLNLRWRRPLEATRFQGTFIALGQRDQSRLKTSLRSRNRSARARGPLRSNVWLPLLQRKGSTSHDDPANLDVHVIGADT
jgi:hypothetical protein